MGWSDYIANQSGEEISVHIEWKALPGPGQLDKTVAAGENVQFNDRGANCIYYIRVSGNGGSDSKNIQMGDNECQNWEFLIGKGVQIVQTNGFIGRPPGAIQQQYPPTGAGLLAMPEGGENYDEQRKMGSALAAAAGASKTQAAIESENACFKTILTTAAEEGGMDKLVAALLDGPPEWAYQALQYLDLSDSQKSELTAKAAGS